MSALEEERTDARVGGAALRRQQLDLGWRKKVGQRPECGVVLLDIVGERRDPRLTALQCLTTHARPRWRGREVPPPRGRACVVRH